MTTPRTPRNRPGPAIIVAVMALVAAVVGTALAGPGGSSSAISQSKVKKIAKKQANKVLTRREASLNVNSAKNADNANTVNGLPASSLHRAAFAQADNEVKGSATLLTTTITAPVNGTLLINAHSETVNFIHADAFVCWIELNDNRVTGSTGVLTEGGSGGPEDDCGSVAAASVPAGTYKVDFEFQSVFGDASNWGRTLTAQFVAFNGAGTTPNSAAPRSAKPPDRPHPEVQR